VKYLLQESGTGVSVAVGGALVGHGLGEGVNSGFSEGIGKGTLTDRKLSNYFCPVKTHQG